jgi:tetratricopeptide (TPR) repeat protein
MIAHVRRVLLALVVGIIAAGCASTPTVPPVPAAPKYPGYPFPDVPAALAVAPAVRDQQEIAWRRLQSGDLRGANRDFSAILKTQPAFYPAEAGLGFAYLADKQLRQASARFSAALAKNDRYLPAWTGQMEAALAGGNDAEAMTAMERILALDPKREAVRSRLEILKFRQIQSAIETGRRARTAGRLEDAQAALERALALSPSSAAILRELALTEIARGALDPAEAHARRATQADTSDAEAFATLATVLEAKERYRDAATALSRAATLEPRPEWKAHAAELKDRAEIAALPAEYRALPMAPTISRALVAAYVGIRLEDLITGAPRKVVGVATDVRNHWASPWILPVVQAGVMEIYPNHTFQPASTVRRSDLALVAAQLIGLASSTRPAELARWKAARPRFTDLGASNLYYTAAALAVTAGAMDIEADKFEPTKPATGADLMAVVARIEQIVR